MGRRSCFRTFNRPIHNLSAAAILGYVIDVLVRSVDGDHGALDA